MVLYRSPYYYSLNYPIGIATGKCSNSQCEVYAWCPPEEDLPPSEDTSLNLIQDFTIFIKAYVRWEQFDVSRYKLYIFIFSFDVISIVELML